MNYEKAKIKSFCDLNAWKEVHSLALEIYGVTKEFPREEVFALTSQLRRAVVSITSNIAEGFSRNSYKEKCQFYSMALGSLTEVQSQMYIAKDVSYVSKENFILIEDKIIVVSKILNGLIKKTKSIIQEPITHNS